MVPRDFIQGLKDKGIENNRVLEAMQKVPRHEFLPKEEQSRAYDDTPVPIGFGQTISQPYIVAFMTEKLELKPTDKVLEIGTGSGYQAAVLSLLVKEVYSLEVVELLARSAKETFEKLGYHNIQTKMGSGYQGWIEHAPYDAIIVTCAAEKIPPALLGQLKINGRMIIPIGERAHQELCLIKKQHGAIKHSYVLPVQFVPMV